MSTIKQDETKIAAYQDAFAKELIGLVKIALADSTLPKEEIKRLTNDVAFGVAAYFDGAGDYSVAKGGDEFRPILAFQRKEEPEVLYFCPGGVLHELVEEN